ncbi:MAG: RdgB/HAM1 family non-canonical purine NTP pyrophosphatase [Epsilonproteobacteria bacterium]|nr:RdgB/HAM1 family non-canonical purine NTP pyrophosphatase [Campylobacterota bacterium]
MIVLASSNKGKIAEIKKFFNQDVVAFSELMEPFEIEENGESFAQNAIIKAEAIYKKLPNHIIIADDSGISVPALGGIPGIYSARYAKEGASDKENLNKLINTLKEHNIQQTPAFYTSAIAIASKYGIFHVHGFMYGNVIAQARGNKGFGYDPMFVPDGFDKTLGELDFEVKQSFSHRTKALKLAKYILDVIK